MNADPSPSTSLFLGSAPSPDAISRRAYELWEREGRPAGNDLEHWLRAEQELSGGATVGDGAGSEQRQLLTQPSEAAAPVSAQSERAPARNGRRSSKSPFSVEPGNGSGAGGAAARRDVVSRRRN